MVSVKRTPLIVLKKLKNHILEIHGIKASTAASVTIETSLALPLFMFFCIQLMSVINLFQIHSHIEAAMHQEVAKASLEAYGINKVIDGNVVTDVITEGILCSRVINRVGKGYLDDSMIVGGSGGIRPLLAPAHFSDQDTVDLILCYKVKPLVDILGFSEFTMGNRVRMKKWTGYVLDHVAQSQGEDELVYVTETGVVYHKSRNCSHIMLSISTVNKGALSGLRNNGGEKYHACEKCGNNAGKSVFITDEGNRYHSSLSCSGLKRTVYVVKLSEAGGKGACSRCCA